MKGVYSLVVRRDGLEDVTRPSIWVFDPCGAPVLIAKHVKLNGPSVFKQDRSQPKVFNAFGVTFQMPYWVETDENIEAMVVDPKAELSKILTVAFERTEANQTAFLQVQEGGTHHRTCYREVQVQGPAYLRTILTPPTSRSTNLLSVWLYTEAPVKGFP